MSGETLHKYRVTYTDDGDDCCPHFTWCCRAYNAEHAEMKFDDTDDDSGWKVLKVERVKETA